MISHPSLLSVLPVTGKTHTEPLEFVAEVLERARANGWDLVVNPMDVPLRYVWHWTLRGVQVAPAEEVLSCNADEVRLRACLRFCRERAWPISYEPGRHIHLDIELVAPLPAAAGPGFVPNSAPAGSPPFGLPAHEVANPSKPTVHAAALRGAGVYVPPHIHDHEEIPV